MFIVRPSKDDSYIPQKKPSFSGNDKGALMALCTTSNTNIWIDNVKSNNIYNSLLKDGYYVNFDKLKCITKWSLDRKTLTIKLDN